MFSTILEGNLIEKAEKQHSKVLQNRELMELEGETFENIYQTNSSTGVNHNDSVEAALSFTLETYGGKSGHETVHILDNGTFKTVRHDRTRDHQRGRLVYIGAYRAKTWACKPILEMQKVQAILVDNNVPYISEFIEGILSTYPAGYRAFEAVITYVESVGFPELAKELQSEYQASNEQGAIL